MTLPLFLQPLGGSSRAQGLAGLARLHEEIATEQARFAAALARACGEGEAGLVCPPGCGTCCHGFCPDILPLEAEYIAAWLGAQPPRHPVPRGDSPSRASLPSGTCPFHDPDSPGANCGIYPVRPLVCRFFGYSPSHDATGRPAFSLCRHMPRPAGFPSKPSAAAPGSRHLDAPTLDSLADPPFSAMADWGRQLLALAPDEAGRARLITEALPAAQARIGLLLALSREPEEPDAPAA